MLLIGVLGVAVTCVHELIVFSPTSSVQQLFQKLDVSSFLAVGEHLQASSRLRPTGNVFRCGIRVA